jgi:hypothetical protein
LGHNVWQTSSKPVPKGSNHDRKAYYEAAAALRERQIEGKERMRRRLAALSLTEKIKILEKLRDRELSIAVAGLRRKPGTITKKSLQQ